MKTSLIPFTLLFAAGAAAVHAEKGTAEWPQFRGPDGQGVSQARNLPVTWGLKKGVAWKTELPGRGWASPVVSAGKVIISASQEKGGKVTLGVVAVDAATGKVAWGRTLFTPTDEDAEARHAKNSLSSSTPFIADGIVYAHFAHMGTAALKLADGEVLWKQQIKYKPLHGTGSSPVLVDGLLVFHADGSEDPTLVALDAKTGKLKWRVKRNQEVKRTFSFSTPLVFEDGDRTLLLSPASGMIGAYQPKDGKLVWKVRYGEGYSVVPRPVMANGLIYVATGFGKPNLLAIKPGGAKGDVTDTHVAWEESKYIPKTPSFVAGSGFLYIVDDTGSLTCRNGKSGKLLWREKLAGNFSSSPVLVGDTLYVATEDGVFFVIKVSGKGAKVLSEIDMEERIFASPAAVDGALYIRSEEHLWKISGK